MTLWAFFLVIRPNPVILSFDFDFSLILVDFQEIFECFSTHSRGMFLSFMYYI